MILNLLYYTRMHAALPLVNGKSVCEKMHR